MAGQQKQQRKRRERPRKKGTQAVAWPKPPAPTGKYADVLDVLAEEANDNRLANQAFEAGPERTELTVVVADWRPGAGAPLDEYLRRWVGTTPQARRVYWTSRGLDDLAEKGARYDWRPVDGTKYERVLVKPPRHEWRRIDGEHRWVPRMTPVAFYRTPGRRAERSSYLRESKLIADPGKNPGEKGPKCHCGAKTVVIGARHSRVDGHFHRFRCTVGHVFTEAETAPPPDKTFRDAMREVEERTRSEWEFRIIDGVPWMVRLKERFSRRRGRALTAGETRTLIEEYEFEKMGGRKTRTKTVFRSSVRAKADTCAACGAEWSHKPDCAYARKYVLEPRRLGGGGSLHPWLQLARMGWVGPKSVRGPRVGAWWYTDRTSPVDPSTAQEWQAEQFEKGMARGRRGRPLPLFEDTQQTTPLAESALHLDDDAKDAAETAAVNQALSSLTPRQAQAYRLHYGLDGGREHTLEEIGEKLGVTKRGAQYLVDTATKNLEKLKLGVTK